MTLAARLEAMMQAMPASGSLVLTRDSLAELLAGEGDRAEPAAGADLTASQVAAMFGRGESTVRTWLAAGRFPNAYRLLGREWRVPASDVAAMQRAEAERFRAPAEHSPRRHRTADTGAWRQHLNPETRT